MFLEPLRGWTREQRHTVIAAYLGWTLDAFDFFLLIFLVTDVSKAFDASVTDVTIAITLTLALRPVGAFLFGRLADRYGRKPVMMIDVMLYAGLGFLTAFAPNLTMFVIIRALFGIAMGGEWGVGASLTMESIPAKSRGLVSGFLQAGYPSGLLHRLRGLWPDLSLYRLARHVHGGLGACAARALHPPQCEGIAGLPCRARQSGAGHARRAQGALAAGALRHALHDGDELLQPRHAGSLSDASAGRPRARSCAGQFDQLHRRCGRHHRRARVRRVVAAHRPPARADLGRAAGAAGDPALGVLRQSRAARFRRLRHAVHGAGLLGHRARASQRDFTAPRRAAPSPASSTSSAISSPPTTRRCRRRWHSPMAATARRWRWWR